MAQRPGEGILKGGFVSMANHQQTLWGTEPRDVVPLSRATDPETSRAAALGHASKAKSHRAMLYRAMKANPGSTSAELGQLTGLDRVEAARRCPELRDEGLAKNGPARKCRVCGKASITWVVV